MKQTLPSQAFSKIKCKTLTLFFGYTILLLFRLAMYMDLRIAKKQIYVLKTDEEIPLYISEIIMSVLIIYMLFSTSFTTDEEDQAE
jgi:hypothetical protein